MGKFVENLNLGKRVLPPCTPPMALPQSDATEEVAIIQTRQK